MDTYRGLQMANNEIQIQGNASSTKSSRKSHSASIAFKVIQNKKPHVMNSNIFYLIPGHRDCDLLRNKLAFSCQLLQLLVLLFALPVYYKGLEVPSQPGR